MIIGTHNSGSGERSRRWWMRLLVPFARTQEVGVLEQYGRGVRWFDLRVRRREAGGAYAPAGGGMPAANAEGTVAGCWVLAHGAWESGADVEGILRELDWMAGRDGEKCYVSVSWEGRLGEEEGEKFLAEVKEVMWRHDNLVLMEVGVKKPKWRTLWIPREHPVWVEDYYVLDGRDWRVLLPVPRLWWWVWKRSHIRLRSWEGVDVSVRDFV